MNANASEPLKRKPYERKLRDLHAELVRLQEWVKHAGGKVCIIFEGRDGAGKGGVIKAITERVSPRVFVSHCPWDPQSEVRKPQKYGMKCGAYMPDIGRVGPPDLPPALTGLKLVEGGRNDMLPAEPWRVERRRRVGGGDEE